MVHVCCVPLCKSKSKNKAATGISFHEFPVDPLLCAAWLKVIARDNFEPNRNSASSLVCSIHFKETDYHQGLKVKRLKKNVTPSIFPGYPSYMLPKTTTKRASRQIPTSKFDVRTTSEYSTNLPNTSSSRTNLTTSFKQSRACSELRKNLDIPTAVLKKTKNVESVNILRKTVKKQNLVISRLNKKIEQQNQDKKDQQYTIDNLRQQLLEMDKNDHFKTLSVIQDSAAKENCAKASFLLDMICNFPKKRPGWSKETIKQCVLWRYGSSKGYKFARTLIKLPSNTTLKTYLGTINGESRITDLIKGRLTLAAKKLINHEKIVSLVIDETSLDGQLIHIQKLDRIFGQKDTTKFTNTESEPIVANQLLCFLVNGISTPLSIPGALFFSKQLTGKELYDLTHSVIHDVEKCGFVVVRIVADNRDSNVAMMRTFCGGSITLKAEVTHPIDYERPLFLSFNPIHIIKSVRTQLLEVKEQDNISGKYIKLLFEMRKDMTVKPIKLTRKHVYPTNFDKMSVGLAIDIFSVEVIAALRYLKNNSFLHPEAFKFKDCGPTIEYLTVMNKWFDTHNVGNRSHYLESQNEDETEFFSLSDERPDWLENTFIDYMCDLKERQPSVISHETLRAIILTSQSTSSCIKYLIGMGFQLTSDSIETSVGNDTLDAKAAVFSIEKIFQRGSKTFKKMSDRSGP